MGWPEVVAIDAGQPVERKVATDMIATPLRLPSLRRVTGKNVSLPVGNSTIRTSKTSHGTTVEVATVADTVDDTVAEHGVACVATDRGLASGPHGRSQRATTERSRVGVFAVDHLLSGLHWLGLNEGGLVHTKAKL